MAEGEELELGGMATAKVVGDSSILRWLAAAAAAGTLQARPPTHAWLPCLGLLGLNPPALSAAHCEALHTRSQRYHAGVQVFMRCGRQASRPGHIRCSAGAVDRASGQIRGARAGWEEAAGRGA